ncbi:MAG: endolytic transglycosylase MltG [Rubrivivax sp.]
MAGTRVGSRIIARLVAWAALVIISLAATLAWWLHRPLDLATPEVELSIERGTPAAAVAQAWVDAGVKTSAPLLAQWFRWSGQARQIRAGSYEVESGVTPRRLLEMMVQGEQTLEAGRCIEGWNFRQVRQALARAPHLRQLTAGLDDAAVMAALGRPGQAAEGRFFPDTYLYSRGVSDLTVLKRSMQTMDRHLARIWAERAPGLPLSNADEALILASIIEKETGLDEDRERISAVFVNRLRIGMPLQTDPTVIYGLGEAFDGNLRKRDLRGDTPWNTYVRRGLPPTPIAMPGLASLRAAVRPQATRELYFVARGDGSSAFSESLADHNRAVNRYQRGGP